MPSSGPGNRGNYLAKLGISRDGVQNPR
jgi:hypothetical protein